MSVRFRRSALPARFVIGVARRPTPETGADPWSQLGSYVGKEVLTPAVIEALQDPATQAELEKVVVQTLEADRTKRALRPYAVEAAIWATLAITLGAAVWRWITQR